MHRTEEAISPSPRLRTKRLIGPLRVGLSDVVCRLGFLALLLYRGYKKIETQDSRGGLSSRAWSPSLGLRGGACVVCGYLFSGRCLYMATSSGTPMAKWVAWMVMIAIRSCVPDKGVAMEATSTSQPRI